MYFSAARSRSAVVTPSRTLPSSSLSVRTRMAPAAAILSISSGVLRMITSPHRVRAASGGPGGRLGLVLVLHPQRGDRRAEVVVNLGRAAGAVEAVQDVALVVVVDERRGLVAVDLQAAAHRLLAVVLALAERLAVDVADLVVLRRVVLEVVGVAVRAHAPAREPLHDVVLGHVDEERGREPAVDLPQRLVERLGLLVGAREAVEEEAVLGVRLGEPVEDHADDDLVGDEVAAVHVLLGLLAEVRLLLDRLAQHVPRRDVREREVLLEALRLGALSRAGRAEQDEVELGHRERESQHAAIAGGDADPRAGTLSTSGSPRSCASSAAPRAASSCPGRRPRR